MFFWATNLKGSIMFKKFVFNEAGATAIEYGLIAAAMGVALVLIMPVLASQIVVQFSNVGSHIASGK